MDRNLALGGPLLAIGLLGWGWVAVETVRAELAVPARAATAAPSQMMTCFSPEGHCEETVAREIGMAQRQILMHAYSFTSSTGIPAALMRARQRGVQVSIIIDRTTPCGEKPAIPDLAKLTEASGEPTFQIYVDKHPPIAHEKALIIDDSTVVQGSYNWTRQATYNSEDLNVARDRGMWVAYEKHWQSRKAVSVPYVVGSEKTWCEHSKPRETSEY